MRQSMRIILGAVLLAALLFATVTTRTEISGTSAAVPIASSGVAVWVQVIADPNNANAVRLGDSTVSTTVGARVAPGGGLMLPYKGDQYSLAQIYVYVVTGDKVSVLWAN